MKPVWPYDLAHERHLNTDLLLGLLFDVIRRRPDFRLIIMSATIDLQLFARYFGGCPVIQVPGRLYPIKTHWLPPQPKDGKDGVPKDRPSNAELKEKAAKGGRGAKQVGISRYVSPCRSTRFAPSCIE